MCGISGLFVGCPLSHNCPKRLLGNLSCHGSQKDDYKSVFGNWYDKSSVRSSDRKILSSNSDGDFFPTELIAIYNHPIIHNLSDDIKKSIIIQQLYRYLDFTSKLELIVVNRVVMSIANKLIDFNLPEEMIMDAYKIYCDEGYHALFSYDMKVQVEKQTGATYISDNIYPYFIRRLHKIQSSHVNTNDQELIELFFVIISETLITGLLSKLPKSNNTKIEIKNVVYDHAIDEGKHHIYFSRFLFIIWNKLSIDSRNLIQNLIPDLIKSFLSPDLDSIRNELGFYNLSKDDIEQVIGEVYTDEVVNSYIRSSSVNLVRYFAQLGIFDSNKTQDIFCNSGIINDNELVRLINLRK